MLAAETLGAMVQMPLVQWSEKRGEEDDRGQRRLLGLMSGPCRRWGTLAFPSDCKASSATVTQSDGRVRWPENRGAADRGPWGCCQAPAADTRMGGLWGAC